MMGKMKRVLYLLSIAILLIAILVLMDTYALFETDATGEVEQDIGKWRIEVNDVDISLQDTITLSDFTYSVNSHTDDGYFAPGRSATFDIEIDTSGCDVSVAYALSIDDSVIEDYPNIYFSIMDADTNQALSTNTYSGVISVSSQNRVKNLQISLNWLDDSSYDESDTSLIGEELAFVIDANFQQYLGE